MAKKKETITVKLTTEQLRLLTTGLCLVRDDIRSDLNQANTAQGMVGLKYEDYGKPSSKAEKISKVMDSVDELENILRRIKEA
tara:strand:- start:3319 stop:3567 length:249 start_codon:yes stop_codon:yes gene_type:complete